MKTTNQLITKEKMNEVLNYLDMGFKQCKYQYHEYALNNSISKQNVLNVLDESIHDYEKIIYMLKEKLLIVKKI